MLVLVIDSLMVSRVAVEIRADHRRIIGSLQTNEQKTLRIHQVRFSMAE